MPSKYLAATMLALVVLSGCSSTGANNTTYAQWYGPNPVPNFSSTSPGGVRVGY